MCLASATGCSRLTDASLQMALVCRRGGCFACAPMVSAILFDRGEYCHEADVQKTGGRRAVRGFVPGAGRVREGRPGLPGEPWRGEHHCGRNHRGTLLDAGYTLRAVGENGAMGDVDSAAQLSANSYYSGLYLAKDGVNCAGLEVTTEEAVPLAGGTVAKVYVATAEGHTLDGVTFDGVALSELTPDVLAQHVEGCEQKENGVYELAGRDYTVRANYENGQLVLLEMSRNYAVSG